VVHFQRTDRLVCSVQLGPAVKNQFLHVGVLVVVAALTQDLVQIPCMTRLCISVPAKLLTISCALREGLSLAGCATAELVAASSRGTKVWLSAKNSVCTQRLTAGCRKC
jgi:hypothetical protein